ncbi:DUF6087 family protein [Kitasatospora sp. NPDC058218]|uniref:DUF6087 family protein n=1 Tax=Kitasatospora sp. NPDC058218 TaxID=3346385 RepID=UPI0036DD2BD5
MADEPLDEWAARRAAGKRAPGTRRAVPLIDGPQHGAHVNPEAPRALAEWDGIQWSATGVAPDYASAQRALTPPRPETVALPPTGKLPPASEQPFRPTVRFYRPEA